MRLIMVADKSVADFLWAGNLISGDADVVALDSFVAKKGGVVFDAQGEAKFTFPEGTSGSGLDSVSEEINGYLKGKIRIYDEIIVVKSLKDPSGSPSEIDILKSFGWESERDVPAHCVFWSASFSKEEFLFHWVNRDRVHLQK